MSKEVFSLTRKQISEFAKDQQTVRAIENLFTVNQNMIGDKGDITVSATAWTINNNVVGNQKLANVNQNTIKGRVSSGVGSVEDLTPTQAANVLPVFDTVNKGVVPASGSNTNNFLKGDGTWSPVSGTLTDGDKGDIDVTGSGSIWTIDNNAVSNNKMEVMPNQTLKGNISGATNNPSDLTFTQVTQNLDAFTTTDNGVVPAPIISSGRFLQDSGIWQDVPGTISDGNKGDITVASSGATFTVNNNVIDNAKLSQMPTNTIKGNNTGLTADAIDLTSEQVATMLPVFSVGQKGVVPDPVTVSGRLLSDNGVFIPAEVAVPLFTTTLPGTVSNPSTITGKILRDSNSWGLVDNTNMEPMPSHTIKGNNTAGNAQPNNLTGQDVANILPFFTTITKGLVPLPVTSSDRVLSDNATWRTVSDVLDTVATPTTGSILYRDISGWNLLPPGAANSFLQLNASSLPAWSNISSSWLTAAKNANQSIVSNATLFDDVQLSFNITAGTYVVFSMIFAQVITGPSGIKVSCRFTGSSTFNMTAGNSYGSGVTSSSSSAGPAPVIHVSLQAGFTKINYDASFTCTNSGTFFMQWAQNTSNPSALTVFRGSFVQLLKVA